MTYTKKLEFQMSDFNYIVKNVGSESLEKFRGKTKN